MKRLTVLTILFLSLMGQIAIADRRLCIMVYPFENRGDPHYSWISAGMTDSLIADLSAINSVAVVTAEASAQAVDESSTAGPESAVITARMAGANALIIGSYTVNGDRLEITANLINVKTGAVERTFSVAGALDGIFLLQDQIVFALMSETDNMRKTDSEPSREKEATTNKSTVNMAAYEAYSKGLEKSSDEPLEALRFFMEALRIDPEYIDADIKISSIYCRLGIYDQAALKLLGILSLLSAKGEKESVAFLELEISLGYVYKEQGKYELAFELYKNALELLERLEMRQSILYVNLLLKIANIYRIGNDFQNAISLLERGLEICMNLGLSESPTYAVILTNIGIVYKKQRDYRQAFEFFDQALRLLEKIGLANTSSYAAVLFERARANIERKQLAGVLKDLVFIRTVYDKVGLHSNRTYALLLSTFANYYELMNDLENAGKYYRMSYELYNQIGFTGPEKAQAGKNAERLGY